MLMTESTITTRIATRFCVFSPTSMPPSTMGPTANLRNLPEVNNPVAGRNRGPEDAEELAKCHAHGGDRAGLDDEE